MKLRPWSIALSWMGGLSLLIALAHVWLGVSAWRQVGRELLTAMTYSVSIGTPLAVALTLGLRFANGQPLWVRTGLPLAVSALLVVPGTFGGTLFLEQLGVVAAAEFWARFERDLRLAMLISVAVGLTAGVVGHARGRLADAEGRRATAERLAVEAQLSSLTARLQPHFLFNTLNSIASLIPVDPARAEALVERFSGLLRASLDLPGVPAVALERELELVSDYLDIAQARLGGRLRCQVFVEEGARALRIPPFALQSLVENSLKYAVAPRLEGGEVRVRAERQGGRLRLSVWDSGPGFERAAMAPGHGLANLEARLQALYGAEGRLAFRPADGGFEVAIEVPA
jgi:signal transduction histidine kinase